MFNPPGPSLHLEKLEQCLHEAGVNEACPVCNLEAETPAHLLLHWPVALQVWIKLNLDQIAQNGDTMESAVMKLLEGSKEKMEMFRFRALAMWWLCN